MTRSRISPAALALAALVIAAVATGLWVIESPAQARMRRIDSRRVEDLRHASGSINFHSRTVGRLPAAIGDLAQPPDAAERYRDPVSGEPYEYRPTGDRTYDLCAVFARPSAGERYGAVAGFVWDHPSGRHCFHCTAPDK